ncbi:MAG: condensation domain-containing protein, partial [Acidobacteriota bacterium]
MSDSRPATRRALEEALAAIWVEILGGADDDGAGSATRAEPADFLALGGSSLDAFRVAGRIADRLGCAIPLSFLLRHPTLADLVDTVAERLSTAEPKELSASPWRLARDRPLPASAPQRQLWYLDRLHRPTTRTGSLGADPSYNMAITVRFDAPLDPTALQHALDEIVRRHEVLRTRIVERDDTPWQIIDPPRAVTIERVDVTAETPTERRSHALRQAEGLLRQPFDLARDLMLRAAILRLDADDHLVVLMMHHIASDGWSFGILLRELAVLYPHCRQDVAAQSPLPPLELQYADLAHWQEEALSGHRLEQLIDFWRDTLAAPPRALDLPTDHPRAAIPSDGGANFDFAFADGQHTALQALAQRHEATLFMLLASAFAALLYRTSGQKDLLLSVPTAQRLHPASEPLIGFFTNMLVVRARWHGEPSFATLLGQVREACLASFAHQDLPFDRLVEALRPDRQLGRTPFVQTGFALQDTFEIE